MDESMSRHPENPNTLIDPYPWANAHPPIRGAGAWVYVGEIFAVSRSHRCHEVQSIPDKANFFQ